VQNKLWTKVNNIPYLIPNPFSSKTFKMDKIILLKTNTANIYQVIFTPIK